MNTKENLEQALLEVTKGMSAYKASKIYGIPKSTLKDKRNIKYLNDNCGAKPVLTPADKNPIVATLFGRRRVFSNQRSVTGNSGYTGKEFETAKSF
ncbi:hypothetical protein JTB14_001686 [Gonioctena quinquepunctata]|nr:hypothetical protein JTB14_001686 [Gonioctena quinquepunctata]